MAAHIVVEDGDVAAGLIGHHDPVAVEDQLAKHATHRNHVVVRMGREAYHLPAPREFRAAPDPCPKCIEREPVDGAGTALLCHQGREVMLGVIARRELEDCLASPLGQPHDGTHRHLRGPVHLVQEPGRGDACKLGRCRLVKVECCRRMTLEECRGHLAILRSLHRAADNAGLVLAGGEQGDLAGFEDRGHAHGDRLVRHVVLAEEIGGGVLSGDAVERDETGPALELRAGFIEADVAGLANAKQLEIDPARSADCRFIGLALGVHALARKIAPGDVNLRRRNVHLREEVLPHEAVVGVDAVRCHRVVLVQIERHHVLERQALIAVKPDQFPIDPDRGGTGREPQHRGAALPVPVDDQLGDALGDGSRQCLRLVDDLDGDAFQGSHGDRCSGRRHPAS